MEYTGPEGNNVIGDFTENEIRAFFEKFAGWTCLASERDFCRIGVDFLFAYQDLYSGHKEGVLVDSKHVEGDRAFTSSVLKSKLESVYKKMLVLPTCESLRNDPAVGGQFDRLRMAITALRFTQFNREQYDTVLRAFDPSTIPGSDKLSVMVAMANDRLGAFAGLKNFAQGKRIVWRYFRYMQNPHEISSPVLSLPMMTSDVIPGIITNGEEEERFVLVFQSPSPKFFQFYSSFQTRLQFNPDHYLFTGGRADQRQRYLQWLPPEQRHRKIHIVHHTIDSHTDLERLFS